VAMARALPGRGGEAVRCERCGAGTAGLDLHDYCAACSKNLCAKCMAAGCCGSVPARSGHVADELGADDEERPAPAPAGKGAL
jgi:hypothetical protein